MAARPTLMLFLALLTGSLTAFARQPPASPAVVAPEVSEQPGILLLYEDDFNRPWVQLMAEGFRSVALTRDDPPSLYLETLDAARFNDHAYQDQLRDWLRQKYRARNIDLVVTMGEGALAFLVTGHGQPWPNTPILHGEVGYISEQYRNALPKMSAVILGDHFPAALGVITQLLPQTREVALIYGASAFERNRMAFFAERVRTSGLGLEPIEFPGLSIDAIVARVASLPSDSVIYLLAPATDADGRVLSPTEACERISAAANRPTFLPGAHDVGCGAVGGLVRDWRIFGRLVGERAMERLAGAEDAIVTYPFERFTSLVFDSRQLNRWGISESRLPAGSQVLFRSPSIWRDYRPQVLAGLAIVAVQTLLITGLVFERRRRRLAEAESRRHLVAMAHLDRRHSMGELTASISHELNQPLGAILRNAEAASMLLARPEPPLGELREIVADIRKDDHRAGEVVRRLRRLLCDHKLEVEPVDMKDVAEEAAAVVAPDALIKSVRVDLELADGTIVAGDRVHLQQVLLNIMINALDAMSEVPVDDRRMVVRAARSNGSVAVSVTDSGPGFGAINGTQIFEPFYTTKGTGMGMGLSVARSIVEAHGGQISAENSVNGGACVRFVLPGHSGKALQ